MLNWFKLSSIQSLMHFVELSAVPSNGGLESRCRHDSNVLRVLDFVDQPPIGRLHKSFPTSASQTTLYDDEGHFFLENSDVL